MRYNSAYVGGEIMKNTKVLGHIAAIFTILVWGTTFISTKVLLTEFQPLEIMFVRLLIGWMALFIACPRRMKNVTRKQELTFAGAGLTGITLYYLMENMALTLTMASNVGVIVSVSPFFTMILASIFVKSEGKMRLNFFLGFVVAMIGIALISFNGAKFEFSPVGDLLTVGAAFVWALYSILTRKMGDFGYSVIQTTRKIFFYGILFMLPTLFFFEFDLDFSKFANAKVLFNFSYLGLCASALCFATWNYASKILGAVKTCIYIYLIPVVTVVTSALILKEPVTWLSFTGTVFAILGLFLSEYNGRKKDDNE